MSDSSKLDAWLDKLDAVLEPMSYDDRLTFIDGFEALDAWLASPAAQTIATMKTLSSAAGRRAIDGMIETMIELRTAAIGVPAGQRQGALARERRVAERRAKEAANRAPRAPRVHVEKPATAEQVAQADG